MAILPIRRESLPELQPTGPIRGILSAFAATLRKIPNIREVLKTFIADLLIKLSGQCDSMDEIADLLEAAIEPNCPAHLRDGGVIKTGFSEELDSLRSISKDGQSWLIHYQKQQIERTGISNLRVGFNQVFGFYIEVNHSAADKVPPDYVRKQTIKNAERYITEELKEYETKALGAEEKALELEQKLFEQLRVRRLCGFVSRLQKLAETVAQCDCLSSLAYLAKRRNYIRPKITGGTELVIKDGKHPVLAETIGPEFTPNDIELAEGTAAIYCHYHRPEYERQKHLHQAGCLACSDGADRLIYPGKRGANRPG